MSRQPGRTPDGAPPRRGRPPLTWLDAEQLAQVPVGTAIAVERTGAHTPRLIGRITGQRPGRTDMTGPRGDVTLLPSDVRRARVIGALYEPGDPVVKRGISPGIWRGGVVRCEGTEVLVEQLGGEFVWLGEDVLEPADLRDQGPPASPRGPVPARAS